MRYGTVCFSLLWGRAVEESLFGLSWLNVAELLFLGFAWKDRFRRWVWRLGRAGIGSVPSANRQGALFDDFRSMMD